MATYKVPQDVEAEDKFVGPFTFKQFIFLGGAGILGYLMFVFGSQQIWILVGIIFPVFAGLLALGIPWSKDQPTEIWLASRIRFFLVPRKRIWSQDGEKDLVQITAPKREAKVYSDGLNQDQVHSRLDALASVVDSRGWAVQNQLYDQESDRLVSAQDNTPDVKEAIVQATPDIMDDSSSVAAQLDTQIAASANRHRQETMGLIAQAREDADARQAHESTIDLELPAPTASKQEQKAAKRNKELVDTINQPAPAPLPPQYAHFDQSTTVTPGQKTPAVPIKSTVAVTANDERDLLEKVHKQQAQQQALKQSSHLKRIDPAGTNNTAIPTQNTPAPPIQLPPLMPPAQPTTPTTHPADPAILALADNDDLNVATIARQAERETTDDDEDEVIVSLR